MSTRTPLLSDNDAISVGTSCAKEWFVTLKDVALNVRDYYEGLITEGKLRVVEEVRGETKGNNEGSWIHCSGCNEAWSTNAYTYCPGCGNPIKR